MLLEELQRDLELVDLGVCLTERRCRADALVEDEGVAGPFGVVVNDIAITVLIGGSRHTRAEVLDHRVSITAVRLDPLRHGPFDAVAVVVAGDGDEWYRAFRDAAGGEEAAHPAEERGDAL